MGRCGSCFEQLAAGVCTANKPWCALCSVFCALARSDDLVEAKIRVGTTVCLLAYGVDHHDGSNMRSQQMERVFYLLHALPASGGAHFDNAISHWNAAGCRSNPARWSRSGCMRLCALLNTSNARLDLPDLILQHDAYGMGMGQQPSAKPCPGHLSSCAAR